MDLRSQNRLIDLLHKHEGWVPHAYQDSLGYWTIGFGRLIDKRKGGGITKDEGEFLLRNDIARKSRELDEHVPWWRSLDEVRQVALMDMAFNLGGKGVANFSNMLSALKSSDWNRAGREALNSRWASQVGVRADEIAQMFRTGEYP